MNVHGRREQHQAVLLAGFASDERTDPADEIGIPGRPERGAAGRAGGRLDAHSRQAHAASTVRTIGESYRGDPEPLDWLRGPEVLTGGEAGLLVQGERGQCGVNR